MKKRGAKVRGSKARNKVDKEKGNKKNWGFLILIIAMVILGLIIIIGLYMNGNVYAETSTYHDSYWICPDGARGEESDCLHYTPLLDEAETFCNKHCKDTTGNGYQQCNAEFHRGQLCNDVSSTPETDDSEQSPNQDYEDSDEDSYLDNSVPCYDSDSGLDITEQLKTKGTCSDSTGSYSDVSVRKGVIKEMSCYPEGGDSYDQYCSGLDYDCTSDNMDSVDGTCIEDNESVYETDSQDSSNLTGDNNYSVYNSNSDYYNPNSSQLTDEQARGLLDNESGPLCPGNECYIVGQCFAEGANYKGYYCKANEFMQQAENGNSCENNYECLSNSCVDNRCAVNSGFFEKIIGWFKGLIG